VAQGAARAIPRLCAATHAAARALTPPPAFAPQVLQHVSQEDVIRAHVQQMARLRAASGPYLLARR
jgi:hypothetical protein